MAIVTKPFKHSPDGIHVNSYEVGEHDDMPPDAVAYGMKIGAIADKPPKPARKPRKSKPDLEQK